MIVDFNALDEDASHEAEIAIIGGGAAGITLALQLLGTGARVALIESGGLDYEPETQALCEGEVTGLVYYPLDSARLRQFGGSTNHWGGQSVPLEQIDFEARDWVPDSGWPISYEAFARYLPRAEPYCRLTLAEAGQDVWSLGPEMPAFPFDSTGFRPVTLRFPDPAFSFGSLHRRTLDRDRDVTCYLHANVVGFQTDPARRHVEAVRLASLDGRRATLRARTFVLATGGIENCRLLLAAGLGNQNDLVGRYVMEHPYFDTGLVLLEGSPYLASAMRRVGTQRVRLDTQLGPERQAEARILNHTVYLVGEPEPKRGRIGRFWERLEDKVTGPDPRQYRLHVRLEHAPDAECRITLIGETDALGMPRVALNYRVGELEARTIAQVCEGFAQALGASDVGRMQIDFDPETWTDLIGWQYHHCGGTRMSADPRHGVVDADCRVHGVDNLYIAGSSVFPTCGHANPTMNLLAFTIRLADHIRAERRA